MRIDGIDANVWVMLGDSEMAEGSVWEAMEATSFHGAGNVTAILDLNRLGQRGETMHGWNADVFRDRAEAFGWSAIQIDGHDVDQIDLAYRNALADERPTLIVARTEKGHGVSFLANQENWHGKAVPADRLDEALGELGGDRGIRCTPPGPPELHTTPLRREGAPARPTYDGPIATRKAFGDALAWLAGTYDDVVVLDGEVGNSTHTEEAEAVAPERFFQLYIAEQCMVGVQTGLQALGKTAFAATFGAFLTRAADQIRMGAISRADLRLCGSHAGVSIGEDGPSQMAIEDLSLFRALNGSTVLYPADGVSTVALVEAMARLEGISYIRTTREATAPLYGADEEFPSAAPRRCAEPDDDVVTLVGAGITLHKCLARRRHPGRRWDHRARARLLQRQADRRGRPAPRAGRHRHPRDRRGPPRRRRARRRGPRRAGGDGTAARARRQGRRHADGGLGHPRAAAGLGRDRPGRRSRLGRARRSPG